MKKWGGTDWIKKIGYELSEEGGTYIEYQHKKSEAELEVWSGSISSELSKWRGASISEQRNQRVREVEGYSLGCSCGQGQQEGQVK